MTDGGSMQAELEACEQAALEADRLRERIAAARRDRDVTQQAEAEAEEALSEEIADVVRLESVSMTRLRAALRGSREADLAREEAEAQLATRALERAQYDAAQAGARLEELERRLQAVDQVIASRPEVMRRREEWLRSHEPSRAAALDALAAKVATQAAESQELDEALAAAYAAASALSAAAGELASARSWSTYDTFFGGGMISSMAKYDRLDQATALLVRADRSLHALGTELRDVGMTDVFQLDIPEGRRFFDVWFDNIFSDWAVRDSIRAAIAQVEDMRARVATIVTTLAQRRTAATAASEALDAERSVALRA